MLEKIKTLKTLPRNEIFWLMITEIFVQCVQRYFGVTLTKVQKNISKDYIQRSLEGKRHTFGIAICRQIGKTELVVMLEWFLSFIYPLFEGQKYLCAMTAPEKGTGSSVFRRIKELFDEFEMIERKKFMVVCNDDQIQLSNGSTFDVFGLFKTYAQRDTKKSTKEGRTYHKILRDEMHLGDDEVYKDELLPTLATTGGVDVFLGNGGFRQCMGKKIIEQGTKKDATVFKLDYDFMRGEMLQEFKRTGNVMWQRWVESQDKYIDDEGIDSDLVRKNLFCEWIVEFGNFITPALLHRCRNDEPDLVHGTNACDVGIDLGKKSDRTVVTITDVFCNVRAWGVFRGDYTEQVEEIAIWLQKKKTEDVLIDYHLQYNRCFCDATGSGDVVLEMLQSRLPFNVIGVVFSPKSKDQIARRTMKAFNCKDEQMRFSYPTFDKHSKFFEREVLDLEKEIRKESELLNYKHPNRPDAHDDFADSTFLSLFGTMAPNQTNVFSDKAF